MNIYLVIIISSFGESENTLLNNYLMTSSGWARIKNSLWLIKTYRNSGEVRNGIKDRVLSNDQVLVIRINPNDWGSYNFSKDIIDWLKRNS